MRLAVTREHPCWGSWLFGFSLLIANVMSDVLQTPQTLAQWVDDELANVLTQSATLAAQLTANEDHRAAAGCHPNHHIFTLGGIFTGAGFGVADIGVVHWWLEQPWAEAFSLLEDNGSSEQPAYLLRRLREVTERCPSVHAKSAAYLRQQDALVDGRLPRPWLRENGKFGLGLPLAAVGLRAQDRDAFAGLWTISFAALRHLISAIAASEQDRLIDLLRPLLDAHFDGLAARGVRSTYLRAKARYRADCESFVLYDAQDHIKRWRALPPTSRQGYLASATACALSLPQPHFRTRGEAADWLRSCGANLRFNEEKIK